MPRRPPDAGEAPGGAPSTIIETTSCHTSEVTGDRSNPHRHDPGRCRSCDPGLLVYLTVADDWRRWALDYGHTIGSKAVA
jgi:hypothetical protein